MRIGSGLLMALMIALAGCASHGEETGVLASERHECQKYMGVAHDECLEQARTGTVHYRPERFETRTERRLRY